MMKRVRRILLPMLLLCLMVAGLVLSFMPRPAAVDIGTVSEGPLVVTVNEDGRTRVKERYVVFAPLAGQLARITLKAGDTIKAGQTVLAAIDPSDPALLDARTVAETEARVKAARSAEERAKAQITAAQAAAEFAGDELRRMERSMAQSSATPREVEDAQLKLTLRTQELRSAEFARQIARFELEQAEAVLLRSRPASSQAEPARLTILAPISGQVLRVERESAGFVTAGTPLMEIGDGSQLEVEVDVLSADAVRILPGAEVSLESWGGEAPLAGRVRLVEPGAFTKVSALGVEEQRVNVIIDFVDSAETRPGLGDGYRVDTRINVAKSDHAIKVPTGALFRQGDGWAAFVVEENRVRRRSVKLGKRNDREAEILEGLRVGEHVVVYPSDRVIDGVRIVERSIGQ